MAEKDDAEDGHAVFGRGQLGVGAEVVGGGPEVGFELLDITDLGLAHAGKVGARPDSTTVTRTGTFSPFAQAMACFTLVMSVRPEFVIYSGNDLAADMIEYGSDYLLGLSTFAPELFSARDHAWRENRLEYFEARDLIQYLGWIGFREPVPAYKHSAAIFLKLTGGIESDEPHPRAPRREEWDREALADAARRMKSLLPRLEARGGKFVEAARP